jgi:hypothetical protein
MRTKSPSVSADIATVWTESELNNLAPAEYYRPQQNALLAALPAAECERLVNDLELVPLTLGQVL